MPTGVNTPSSSRRLFVVETHDQVLGLWREQNVTARRVLHLDFHCDLRGLLINRKTRRAYRIWDRRPDVDEGNFLTHAILEGIVDGVRWVHDVPGGRRYDLKTVKYESDLTALPHRCVKFLRRQAGTPIDFQVIHKRDWAGIEPGELLDIDWDYFASREYAADSIPERVDDFLHHEFDHIPSLTYICYSPDYSHPTRRHFRQFVVDLAAKFRAEVIDVPAPASRYATADPPATESLFYRGARRFYHRAGRALRKRGIY